MQIAFIVAFGVLLDRPVVRSLLVPVLSYDLGDRNSWPVGVPRVGRRRAGPQGGGDEAAPGRLADRTGRAAGETADEPAVEHG